MAETAELQDEIVCGGTVYTSQRTRSSARWWQTIQVGIVGIESQKKHIWPLIDILEINVHKLPKYEKNLNNAKYERNSGLWKIFFSYGKKSTEIAGVKKCRVKLNPYLCGMTA